MTLLLLMSGPGSGSGGPLAPANTVLPVISGTTTVGSTLTTTNGTWSGSPTGYTYQWKRGGTAISGATASTYVLVTADLAATITVTVTASNIGGATAATSTGVGPITNPAFATLDGTPSSGFVTMSNGNLTATMNSSGGAAEVHSTAVKSSGQYYFEYKYGPALAGGHAIGVSLSTAVPGGGDLNNGTKCTAVLPGGASLIYSNNVSTGKDLGSAANNDRYDFAIDLTNRKGWIRRNGGNWNADAAANPATNTNGVTIAAGSFSPSFYFASGSTNTLTANFGASAFTGTVPSGFSGWPA
jgi:hypothetical protein